MNYFINKNDIDIFTKVIEINIRFIVYYVIFSLILK